jgi:hypothetical protein
VATDPSLLALLHGAHERTRSWRGRLRQWEHLERSQQAFRAAETLTDTTAPGAAAHTPASVREEAWMVVFDADGRFRKDAIDGPDPPRLDSRQTRIEAEDGERFWLITEDQVYIRKAKSWDGVVLRLTDPVWALVHDLEVIGEGVSSDRPVLEVRATPRAHQPRNGHVSEMASERLLLVDQERGFLHSDTALIRGLAYDILEVSDLELDIDIDPRFFTPEIPAGFEIIDMTDN